jgi:hypothetical protein
MSKPFSEYLTAKPFIYGRALLKGLGTQGHYVDENELVDFLGYEIKPLNPEEHRERIEIMGLGDIFDDTCAITYYYESYMFISESIAPTRRRCSIFHEAGHDYNDFHPKGVVSIARGSEVDAASYKIIERDAFYTGSEVMFPLKHFISDSTSLPLQFSSVKSTSQKYSASFEATAIRYALTNQNVMAVVVVKENDLSSPLSLKSHPLPEDALPIEIPPSYKPSAPYTPPAPLRVQYCVTSHNFSKFIKPSTGINEDNLIYKTWKSKLALTGEIPASVFGSSQQFSYTAECIPMYGRVFVLLSLPDMQNKLFTGAAL